MRLEFDIPKTMADAVYRDFQLLRSTGRVRDFMRKATPGQPTFFAATAKTIDASLEKLICSSGSQLKPALVKRGDTDTSKTGAEG